MALVIRQAQKGNSVGIANKCRLSGVSLITNLLPAHWIMIIISWQTIFIVRPFHILNMIKIHAWDNVDKQGIRCQRVTMDIVQLLSTSNPQMITNRALHVYNAYHFQCHLAPVLQLSFPSPWTACCSPSIAHHHSTVITPRSCTVLYFQFLLARNWTRNWTFLNQNNRGEYFFTPWRGIEIHFIPHCQTFLIIVLKRLFSRTKLNLGKYYFSCTWRGGGVTTIKRPLP